jgi:hypothetical protein
MPPNGAYDLGEVRAARVVIECEQCNRRGEYSTQRLLERFGPDIGMPALKGVLVKCPSQQINENAPCQARYSKETMMSWS